MNRVFIKTYGCQMNERDSESVACKLQERGYTIVDHEDKADIVLLNTCSVRERAEQKAIGKAGHLAKRKKMTLDSYLASWVAWLKISGMIWWTDCPILI